MEEGDSIRECSLYPGAEVYRSSLKAGTASIRVSKDLVHFNTLPVSYFSLYSSVSSLIQSVMSPPIKQLGVHMHLFSYLDVTALCRLAQTCSYLNELASDPLLWRRLLQRDVETWSSIGHLSHPRIYQEACSDLSPKQM